MDEEASGKRVAVRMDDSVEERRPKKKLKNAGCPMSHIETRLNHDVTLMEHSSIWWSVCEFYKSGIWGKVL
jgi:hypothetical protein